MAIKDLSTLVLRIINLESPYRFVAQGLNFAALEMRHYFAVIVFAVAVKFVDKDSRWQQWLLRGKLQC